MKNKPIIVDSLIVSTAISVFFAWIIPLQSYMANKTIFTFSWMDLLFELFVAFSVLLCAGGIIFFLWGLTTKGSNGNILYALLPAAMFAILVCAYLESGPLSIGTPPIDGDLGSFHSSYQKIVDTAILLFAFGLTFAAVVMLRQYLRLFFASLILLTLASLFDVKVARRADMTCELKSGFCSKYEVAKSCTFSTNRNVMVFVLDSMPAIIAADAVEGDFDLKNKFTGFVAYRNNIGMHECSERGLPGLMTGKYFDKNDSPPAFAMSMYGENSFLYPYYKDDIPVFCNGMVFESGYTNRKKDIPPVFTHSTSRSVVGRKMQGVPSLSLFDVIRFRLTPYAMKESVLRDILHAEKKYPYMGFEQDLYPILAQAPINNSRNTLAMFHTRGVHLPIIYDQDGKKFPENVPDCERLHGGTLRVLKKLADFFEVLKRRGIYDLSTIIVTTDHGVVVMEHPEGEMGQKSANLWVKPAFATNEFAVSSMPTSHCRISALVKQLKDASLGQDDIDKVLYQEVRQYRGRFHSSLTFYDWFYDGEGRLIKKDDLGPFKCR